MFWLNFEWLVFTKIEADGDTIHMDVETLSLWRSMPEKYRGIAIVLEIMRTEVY